MNGSALKTRLARTALKGALAMRPLLGFVPVSARERFRTRLSRAAYLSGAPPLRSDPNVILDTGPASGTFGAHLTGYLQSESGMGAFARRIARALDKADVPLRLSSLTSQGAFPDQTALPLVGRGADDPAFSVFVMNADQCAVLPKLVDQDCLQRRYRIGVWAWELAQFPDLWPTAFWNLDEIWTCSEFTAAAVRAVTDKPVFSFPIPLAPIEPSERDFGFNPSAFKILCAFDLNSFINRKNPKAALEAFKSAFQKGEAVQLILKTQGGARFKQARAELAAMTAGDRRIMIIDETLVRADFAALQSQCDALISLHRSEGFGLNMAEMMGLAKPVIATAYSGNLDYMTDQTACLVPAKLVPVPQGSYPYAQQAEWAEPDIDAAIAHLKRLYKNPEERQMIGAAAQGHIRNYLDEQRIGSAMRARLEQIAHDDPGLIIPPP